MKYYYHEQFIEASSSLVFFASEGSGVMEEKIQLKEEKR